MRKLTVTMPRIVRVGILGKRDGFTDSIWPASATFPARHFSHRCQNDPSKPTGVHPRSHFRHTEPPQLIWCESRHRDMLHLLQPEHLHDQVRLGIRPVLRVLRQAQNLYTTDSNEAVQTCSLHNKVRFLRKQAPLCMELCALQYLGIEERKYPVRPS
jgi:hypothetical protein